LWPKPCSDARGQRQLTLDWVNNIAWRGQPGKSTQMLMGKRPTISIIDFGSDTPTHRRNQRLSLKSTFEPEINV
jgi:hypothetical protein